MTSETDNYTNTEEFNPDIPDVPNMMMGGPDLPDSSSFTQEKLMNFELLRHTSYLDTLIAELENTTLTAQCKRSLRKFINNHFDPTFVLANFTDNVYPKLVFDINAIILTVGIWPDDISNPDFLIFMENIRSHYDAFVTRAKGPQRERMLQGRDTVRQEVYQTTTQDSIPQQSNQPPKRKNLLGF